MVFRRRTDYLLCRNCLRLYSVTELRDRLAEDVTDTVSSSEVPDLSYFSMLDGESDNGGASLLRRAEDQSED